MSPSSLHQLPSIMLNIGSATLTLVLYNQLIASSSTYWALAEICPASVSSHTINLANGGETNPFVLGTPPNSLGTDNKNSVSIQTSKTVKDTSITQLSDTSANLNQIYGNNLLKPAKVCPDFKDDENQSSCCRSQITQGAYYCCTEEHHAQLQWELDKEAWREFIQSHLSSIVISLIIFSLIFLILTILICKRFTFCYLYRPKTSLRPTGIGGNPHSHYNNRQYSFASGRYHLQPLISSTYHPITGAVNNQHYAYQHQQTTMIQKQLAPYEAPPPYDFAVAPPPRHLTNDYNNAVPLQCITSTQQSNNDWECIVENEANGIRQATTALPDANSTANPQADAVENV